MIVMRTGPFAQETVDARAVTQVKGQWPWRKACNFCVLARKLHRKTWCLGLQSNEGFRHTSSDIFTPQNKLVQASPTTANVLPRRVPGEYTEDSLSLSG